MTVGLGGERLIQETLEEGVKDNRGLDRTEGTTDTCQLGRAVPEARLGVANTERRTKG
jgi:hypothetical protein